jgi:hypothetical protein
VPNRARAHRGSIAVDSSAAEIRFTLRAPVSAAY